MHWGMMTQKDHKDINLSSLRMLLVADGSNPWSLSSCDTFLDVFQSKGLKPDCICPTAGSTETMTISIRRPNRTGPQTSGRGILSMSGLSYGVVRVDQENSLTSLTLQDVGQVLPGALVGVIKVNGNAALCQTDEIGEICISSKSTSDCYFGLTGLTLSTFKIIPNGSDGRQIGNHEFVRSGLLGFLGPGGLVFICGSKEGLIEISGRKHNTDDLIATILAVEPIKFIYRGRIAVFSIKVLKDERIIVVAEQRTELNEEECFQWMSRVLQAVDSIHSVGVYCLALVPSNTLPKTPLGAINIGETKNKFLDGTLHPNNVLMCPHTCILNLPKPREHHPEREVGPGAVLAGSIVQGRRLAEAKGRDVFDDDSDTAKKYQFIGDILRWRATTSPDHILYTVINSKVHIQLSSL
jgi:acyl-CoA synthetase (AMP-forming)/AMP-acid ligase II